MSFVNVWLNNKLWNFFCCYWYSYFLLILLIVKISATQRGVANAYNNTEKGVNKASKKTKQGIQRGLKATSNVATSLSSKICNGSDRTIKKIDSVFE